jgi:hypothetical protein
VLLRRIGAWLVFVVGILAFWAVAECELCWRCLISVVSHPINQKGTEQDEKATQQHQQQYGRLTLFVTVLCCI